MKIAVAGTGYVGLSLSVLLAQSNEVMSVDIIKDKVEKINKRISPIQDDYIEKYMSEKKLNLVATLDAQAAYKQADIVIVSTPTNYDENINYFNTSSVEEVIELVRNINPQALIVIKSTIPVGFTEQMCKKYNTCNIVFSPEFLRESKALYDNLYPSRIIVGVKNADKKVLAKAKQFATLLQKNALKEDIPVLFMEPTEAEAVKLFSNSYLALRVAYFNELDTYAETKNLNAKSIIEGVCLDPRIGGHYNNPSFGYGGYCLPKDTKQLKTNYSGIPQNLITAMVDSNKTRKEFIADQIEQLALKLNGNKKKDIVIGIYRLTMKFNSDNFRQSAIQDIIKILQQKKCPLVIYEPTLNCDSFDGVQVCNDLEKFKGMATVIVANRNDHCLNDVSNKIYTRDIYNRD